MALGGVTGSILFTAVGTLSSDVTESAKEVLVLIGGGNGDTLPVDLALRFALRLLFRLRGSKSVVLDDADCDDCRSGLGSVLLDLDEEKTSLNFLPGDLLRFVVLPRDSVDGAVRLSAETGGGRTVVSCVADIRGGSGRGEVSAAIPGVGEERESTPVVVMSGEVEVKKPRCDSRERRGGGGVLSREQRHQLFGSWLVRGLVSHDASGWGIKAVKKVIL